MKNTSKLNSFMSNVNKLTLGRSTSNELFGRVTLIKSADYTRGKNTFLGRSGYGTRKFSVSGSKLIKNGCYSLGGLRAKLSAVA